MGDDNVISKNDNAHTAYNQSEKKVDNSISLINQNQSNNNSKQSQISHDIFNKPLTDHQVEPLLLKRWQELMLQWGDDKIIDCTTRSATLILIYATLGKRYLKEAIGSGRCVFYWDRQNEDILHLKRLEESKTIDYLVKISQEGLLSIDDPAIKEGQYNTPQELLDRLTYRTHIVHHRIDIVKDSSLECVLKCTFSSQCQLFYPPEYPPLLAHIALNNHDYITAASVLKHPFIDEPTLPRKQNFRLWHLLELTVSNVIAEGHLSFLGYLLSEYDILSLHTYPFKMAILAKRQRTAEYILKKISLDKQPKAFEEGFIAAADVGDPKLLSWLLKILPQGIVFPLGAFTAQFLAVIFAKFGVEAFDVCVNRLHIQIPWGVLLPELIQTNCSPKSYLPLYLQDGNTIDNLSTETKIKIILQELALEKSSSDVRIFLNEYLPSAEHTQLLSKVLLSSLSDPNKIQKLLELGTHVSKEHFEGLLKVFDGGEGSRKAFSILLNRISDLSQAKCDLIITSAFGESCVKEVFEKFPDLSKDAEFLSQFFSKMWQGSVLATDRLLSDMLSVGRPVTILPNPNLSQESNLTLIDPDLGHEISTDVLVEVFLPGNQIDKIGNVLLKRHECIYEFWWKSIFSGYSNFDNPKWENVIKSTFNSQFLTEKEIEKLIGDAIYYSHLQLVSLWLKQLKSINYAVVIEWYDKALKSGNVGVVLILAENNLVNHCNEVGESFLYMAVKYNLIDFVSALLNCGLSPTLGDNSGATPVDWALEHNDLSICRLLDKKACFDEIIEMLVKLPPEKADQWLFKAYLNSECDDLRELIQELKTSISDNTTLEMHQRNALIAICDQLELFMTTGGAFIVRYPTPFYQNEVHGGYGQAYATYEEQQLVWGQECERHYQKFLKFFKGQNPAILEVFMKLAEVQPKVSKETWRMGLDASLITYFHGRYFMFWQFAQKVYKALLKTPELYKNELESVPEGYRVLYRLDESNVVSLSTLEIRKPFKQGNFEARMSHTDAKVIKLLLPHLDVLFEEIKNFPMPEVNPLAPPLELKRMIAKMFWLGCHLAITARGSSQYMLMFHRYLYNIHGYHTQSWRLRYVQPDCIAIMTPFEVFFEEYYSFL